MSSVGLADQDAGGIGVRPRIRGFVGILGLQRCTEVGMASMSFTRTYSGT
jgi:hypothetical protein